MRFSQLFQSILRDLNEQVLSFSMVSQTYSVGASLFCIQLSYELSFFDLISLMAKDVEYFFKFFLAF